MNVNTEMSLPAMPRGAPIDAVALGTGQRPVWDFTSAGWKPAEDDRNAGFPTGRGPTRMSALHRSGNPTGWRLAIRQVRNLRYRELAARTGELGAVLPPLAA
jgi:hypothetical protein